MGYTNIPPTMSELFWDLDKRIARLETAYRFNAPNVNFATNTPTNPRIGDMYYDTNAGYLKYWNGTIWITIGDSLLGTPIISYTPTWAGTGLTYTGTPAAGRYQRIGKQIHFQIRVNCTNVTNFGTGQYSLTLPTGLAPNYDYVVMGGIHKTSNNTHWNIEADLESGTTTMNLWHPTSNGGMDIFAANKPINLATADYFYIGGNYLIA